MDENNNTNQSTEQQSINNVQEAAESSKPNTDEMMNSFKEKFSDDNTSAANSQTRKQNTSRAISAIIDGQPRQQHAQSIAPNQIQSSQRDLTSGLEILNEQMLVSIAESTNLNEKNDVTMKAIAFKYLANEDKLNYLDSFALKSYVENKEKHFSKDIQCRAMMELAGRSAKKAHSG